MAPRYEESPGWTWSACRYTGGGEGKGRGERGGEGEEWRRGRGVGERAADTTETLVQCEPPYTYSKMVGYIHTYMPHTHTFVKWISR